MVFYSRHNKKLAHVLKSMLYQPHLMYVKIFNNRMAQNSEKKYIYQCQNVRHVALMKLLLLYKFITCFTAFRIDLTSSKNNTTHSWWHNIQRNSKYLLLFRK